MPWGVTPQSYWAYDIHMFAFYLMWGIAVGAFGALIRSIISPSPVHGGTNQGAVRYTSHEKRRPEAAFDTVPIRKKFTSPC